MASPNTIVIGGGGSDDLSLLDILDHVLNSGVVIQGSIVISIGGVDLIYVGLNVVLTSVETALRIVEADDQKTLGTGKWPAPPSCWPIASPMRRLRCRRPAS